MAVNCRGFQSVFSDRALDWSDNNCDNHLDDDDDGNGDDNGRMSCHLAPS